MFKIFCLKNFYVLLFFCYDLDLWIIFSFLIYVFFFFFKKNVFLKDFLMANFMIFVSLHNFIKKKHKDKTKKHIFKKKKINKTFIKKT